MTVLTPAATWRRVAESTALHTASSGCQVPVPVLQVGSGSCVAHWRRFPGSVDARRPAAGVGERAVLPAAVMCSWRWSTYSRAGRDGSAATLLGARSRAEAAENWPNAHTGLPGDLWRAFNEIIQKVDDDWTQRR